MTITVNGIDEVRGLVGQSIGPSEWRTVTQEDIDKFAELSGDDQWIHVDVERAKTESPFGTTIAHGNLTLAMIDGFRPELFESTGFKLGVNYGWNKVRYPAPCRPVPAFAGPPRRSRSTTSAVAGTSSYRSSPSRSRAAKSRRSSANRWPASWPEPRVVSTAPGRRIIPRSGAGLPR